VAKKAVILGVILALGLMVPAAHAGKKPKPYKSANVQLLVAHPLEYGNTGSINSVTAKEFEAKCDVPTSNGLDGYVFAVPKQFQKVDSEIDAVGEPGGAAGYDLDIYLYDANCAPTLAFNSAGTDETGLLPKGTAWIFVHNYLGDPGTTFHIEIKPL
jgi:hypothetical protein